MGQIVVAMLVGVCSKEEGQVWLWSDEQILVIGDRRGRHHHITPALKLLHWLKFPELIHFKVLSLTYNSLQYSQPTYFRKLFIIKPSR